MGLSQSINKGEKLNSHADGGKQKETWRVTKEGEEEKGQGERGKVR